MCFASAAQRTAWRWEKRSSFSTVNSPQTSTTAASRRASSPRRCAFLLCSLGGHAAKRRLAAQRSSCQYVRTLSLRSSLGRSGVQIVYPVEANAVFVKTSDEILEALRQRGWKFYTFIGGAARFMCSWDTTRERIDEVCRELRECAESVNA